MLIELLERLKNEMIWFGYVERGFLISLYGDGNLFTIDHVEDLLWRGWIELIETRGEIHLFVTEHGWTAVRRGENA